MTFLELVTALAEKLGGVSAPATVSGVTGSQLRLVNAISEAWDEIQARRTDWKWMRASFQFNSVAGTAAYTPADVGLTDHAVWHLDTFRIYLTSAGVRGMIPLPNWEWQAWRNNYGFGSLSLTQSYPVTWAERPKDLAIVLGPIPNDVYTVDGEYQRRPTSLKADDDTPAMPARFHRLIVYSALEAMGEFDAAPEVFGRGARKYKQINSDLIRDQTAPMGMPRALA